MKCALFYTPRRFKEGKITGTLWAILVETYYGTSRKAFEYLTKKITIYQTFNIMYYFNKISAPNFFHSTLQNILMYINKVEAPKQKNLF